jgi:hypothetical protein
MPCRCCQLLDSVSELNTCVFTFPSQNQGQGGLRLVSGPKLTNTGATYDGVVGVLGRQQGQTANRQAEVNRGLARYELIYQRWAERP